MWVLVTVIFQTLFLPTPAAQDCTPGTWSDWSICDTQCGPLGTQSRERKIEVLPSPDGVQCDKFIFKEEKPCNRICYNEGTVGVKECYCKKGYQGSCCELDVNECEVANGGCQQKCINTSGSFKCECYDGFRLNDFSGRCEDINECEQGLTKCIDGCVNYDGSYGCICLPPKVLEMDGYSCAEKDYCKKSNLECPEHCVIHQNAATCNCPDGYELGPDERRCVDVDECSRGDFCEGGTCFNRNGTARCECGVGKGLDPTGKKCIDIDECKPGFNQCSHTCKNVNAGHVCLCPFGMVIGSDHRTCEDEDECARDEPPCSHGCDNRIPGYVCSCPEGMELEHDNRTCCKIGECKNPLSSSEPMSKSAKLIVGFSVTAVILVLILVVVVWRMLRRSVSTNEKVLRVFNEESRRTIQNRYTDSHEGRSLELSSIREILDRTRQTEEITVHRASALRPRSAARGVDNGEDVIYENTMVMREIRHGTVPDVYYNRGADMELETRGMGVAPTSGTVQKRNVGGLSKSSENDDYKTF